MKAVMWVVLLSSTALGWIPETSSSAARTLGPLVDTFHYTQPPAVSGGTNSTTTIRYGDIRYGYENASVSWNGFAGFDMSGVPDSATLVSVRLCYYQYGHPWNQLPLTNVVYVESFPSSPHELYMAIRNGSPLDDPMTTPGGWVRRALTAAAVTLVDSCRKTGEPVCLGVRDAGSFNGVAYGMGDWSPERPFLDVEYTTNVGFRDVAARSLAPSVPFFRVGDSLRVAGWLKSIGSSAAYDVPVRFYRGGTTYDSVVVSGIEPGESTFVGAALPPLQSPGVVKTGMCAALDNDWCRHNDTADLTAYVFPSGSTMGEYFEGDDSLPFPPRGWLTFDAGGPSAHWSLQSLLDRRAYTGRYYAFCGRELQSIPDDWLITPGLVPRGGYDDSIGFFASSNLIEADSLEVWALSGPTPADTIEQLLLTRVQQSWLRCCLCLDPFDGQTVYVGFRKNDAGGWHGVSLDDVWSTSDLAPGVEEQTWLQLPALLIAPNPTHGGLVQLSCQPPEPGPGDVTVCDVLGRVVSSERVTLNAAKAAAKIDCRHLATGVYFVSLRPQAGSARAKLVIQ
jgi:hypothetical protein